MVVVWDAMVAHVGEFGQSHGEADEAAEVRGHAQGFLDVGVGGEAHAVHGADEREDQRGASDEGSEPVSVRELATGEHGTLEEEVDPLGVRVLSVILK